MAQGCPSPPTLVSQVTQKGLGPWSTTDAPRAESWQNVLGGPVLNPNKIGSKQALGTLHSSVYNGT